MCLADKVENIKNSPPEITSKVLLEVENKLLDISTSSSNKQPDKIKEVIKEVNEVNSTVSTNTDQSPISVGPRDALIKVSSQLSSAISSLGSSQERQVLQNIQASINDTISDPIHDYNSDVSAVRKLYNTLSAQQKKNVKEALISNVDASLAFKLRSIYGL